MGIELYKHQLDAIEKLRNGNILCGGVGSGKSRAALAYFYLKECHGTMQINGVGSYSPMRIPKDLYIITTARKRDTREWEAELIPFLLSTDKTKNVPDISVVIDSWNNIKKYANVKGAFFIFDEQRIVGTGAWAKTFIKISKENHWILLTATPGDTWSDYAPVFIANGYFKNFTDFREKHCVYNRYTSFPKVEKYIYTGRLIKYRSEILVKMNYTKTATLHREKVRLGFDKTTYLKIMRDRWNIYTDEPVRNASELCYTLRKLINSDPARVLQLKSLVLENAKSIIFYNFDYELDILRNVAEELQIPYAEWNGHKHEDIPKTERWMYLVQYAAGAEGWNCLETNVIIFYSQSYSYKAMIQAAGRIDRMNTPYSDLYYYNLISDAPIDMAISRCLSKKKNFNESHFFESQEKQRL